jgi:hypothetical protein
VTDDAVVVPGKRQLQAYDLASGKSLWAFDIPDGGLCAASFDVTSEQSVALLSGENCTQVTIVDLRHHKQLWSADSGLRNGAVGSGHPSGSNGVSITEETVTVTSCCFGAATLDLSSGKLRHSYAPTNVESTAAYGSVLVAGMKSGGHEIYEVDSGRRTYGPQHGTFDTPWRVVHDDPLVVSGYGFGDRYFALWSLGRQQDGLIGERGENFPNHTFRYLEVHGDQIFVLYVDTNVLHVFDIVDGNESASIELEDDESIAGVRDGRIITVGRLSFEEPNDAVVRSRGLTDPKDLKVLGTIKGGASDYGDTFDTTLTLADGRLLIGHSHLTCIELTSSGIAS